MLKGPVASRIVIMVISVNGRSVLVEILQAADCHVCMAEI